MSETTEKEILEARKQLAAKFGNTQIGGKGTQKRKKAAKHRGNKVIRRFKPSPRRPEQEK